MLKNREVLVGIGGGIAAYKAAELVRLLTKAGARVQVVMTPSGERFISRLTLQALSGRQVPADLFDADEEAEIGHIRIADRAELLVIAPATANLIARLAAGLADDLVTMVALATRAPLVIAPAMNVNMWKHPQTQANLATLIGRGAIVVGPAAGELACGWVGEGRLVEPEAIVAACRSCLGPRDLAGRRLLVTAGPTHEPIDPVRFLGNRSSGKMGFAVAGRAAARGAKVTLVAGPVALPTPAGVERIDVTTAVEMRQAVMTRRESIECIIKAAAVADYRPAHFSSSKIKKHEAELAISLERNPDILAELGQLRRATGHGPLLCGFAAETEETTAAAQEKLERKGCDLVVANNVAEPGSGFGGDTNRVTIFARNAAPEELPLLPKEQVADRLLDRIASLLGTANE